ncbi:hypothetical protein RchiOBHm_Chr1g0361541 [Rosa chinensis]|uniref:Uncharacterized protein n=1 Tax=Rosa chinensis TaxID=74649 RepID=A0A2P6SIY4_ROSCH|nr:hypothetical protein RchiOBHm_Chr1g0361541 [Rosa chinensis]
MLIFTNFCFYKRKITMLHIIGLEGVCFALEHNWIIETQGQPFH